MRLKHVKGAEDAVLNSPHCISLTNELRHNLRSVFDNNNPLMLEIGCGKGQFIIELARRNPTINYIGIERYSSVLLRACQKMDAMETPLPNLKFLCYDAEVLPDLFGRGNFPKHFWGICGGNFPNRVWEILKGFADFW